MSDTMTGAPLNAISGGSGVSGIGGTGAPGGPGAMSGLASGQNPAMSGAMQNLQRMPTEQLQELAARQGGSQQGALASRMLQQRHMMPQQAPANPPADTGTGTGIATTGTAGGTSAAQSSPIAQTQQATGAGIALPPTTAAMARGGGIGPGRSHFDIGGVPTSEQTPWFTKAEAHGSDAGLIHAYSPGRTDTINAEPLAGSYVIPADVISGLGEGNTLAGASVMDRVLNTGPGGIPMPRQHDGRGPPAPPRAPQPTRYDSTGGAQAGPDGARVPIIVAGGEYKLTPDQCRAIGGGDLKRGHDVLDRFVLEVRRRTIADLRKLPPPKKK